MKTNIPLLALALAPCLSFAAADPASSLIRRSEAQINGRSLKSRMVMTVTKGGSTRQLGLRFWLLGRERALVKVLSPSKDKDQGNLRIKLDLWQYLPNIDRIVRVPPSMMLQSWMGSDFSNDDLVRAGDLVLDYDHRTIKTGTIQGEPVTVIECTPHPNAPVVWGKLLVTVRTRDAVPIRREFYAEGGKLVKVMEGSQIKKFGSHTIPTRLVMRNLSKTGEYTTMDYEEVEYDSPIDPSFFSQSNLKRPSLR